MGEVEGETNLLTQQDAKKNISNHRRSLNRVITRRLEQIGK